MDDKRALPLLRAIARRGSPEARAVAVLGLGAQHDRAGAQAVADLAKESGGGNAARAAAAYVLGEIGGEGDRAPLLALAEGTDALSREMALLALARMPPGRDKATQRATISAMADAVFAGGDAESPRAQAAAEAIRRAGCAALVMMNKRPAIAVDPLTSVEDAVDVEAVLQAHPEVVEAAVGGIPHEVLGEDIAAYVVLRPGATVSTGDIFIATAASRLRRTTSTRKEPEPHVGSRTRSPGSVVIRMQRSTIPVSVWTA